MKIGIVSDLHLEFEEISLHNTDNVDVLVLAGDICVVNDLYRSDPEREIPNDKAYKMISASRYRKFFKEVSERFPEVIYVMGNHEFYEGKWVKYIDVLRQELQKYPNITLLERDVKLIGDVAFLGGTLWTDMNKEDPLTLHAVSSMMNDYSVILNDSVGYTKLRPYHTVVRHRQTVDFIKMLVSLKLSEKYVVVSHHAPSILSVEPNWKDHLLMNGAYYSDLSDFILDRDQIKLWIHGHTHSPHDYLLGDTRVVCNPRGYPGEGKAEFKIKIVEI